MNASPLLPKDVLLALRPGDISLYLTSRGWVSKPYGAGGQALQFRHSSIARGRPARSAHARSG